MYFVLRSIYATFIPNRALTVLEWSVSIIAGLVVLCVAEFDKFIRLKFQTSTRG